LIAEAVAKSLVARRIVDDQHLDLALMEGSGDAAQHFLDRRLRIVGDNEDENAFATQLERRNGVHVPVFAAKNGPFQKGS
jgi:hypothetical protein